MADKHQKDQKGKPIYDTAVDDIILATRDVRNADIYRNTFLSRSTILKLRHPDYRQRTKKPQHLTLVGVAAAVGLEYRLVKRRKSHD